MSRPGWPTLATPTERLNWVIKKVENDPKAWVQHIWSDTWHALQNGDAPVLDRIHCGSRGCIAGWAVTVTPPELVKDFGWELGFDWRGAGALALGINEDTAEWLFDGEAEPKRVLRALHLLANLSEEDRLSFDPEDHVYYSMDWITGYVGHVDDLAIEP